MKPNQIDEAPECFADTQQRNFESQENSIANLSAIQSLSKIKNDVNTNREQQVLESNDESSEQLAILYANWTKNEKILEEGDISPGRHIE